MKRRVVVLAAVFFLAGQLAFSGREIAQNQLDNWTSFNAAHGDLWRITWDSLGMPTDIDGGTIWPQGVTAEEKARNFLNELTGIFTLQDPSNELQVLQEDTSRMGTNFVVHVNFREILHGFPVFDCIIKVHVAQGCGIDYCNAIACRLDNPVDYTQLVLSRDSAIAIAVAAMPEGQIMGGGITSHSGYVRTESSNVLVWRITIATYEPCHEWQVTMGQNGSVLGLIDIIDAVDGLANVYLDNPLTGSPQDVTLEQLDWSCFLRGPYADVANLQCDRICRPDLDFRCDTADTHFDEANFYYHLVSAQAMAIALGFQFQHAMKCTVNVPLCNSYYYRTGEWIRIGNGNPLCRNFAREASIIYHEYGHHISHKTIPGGGFDTSSQARTTNEAVSDFFGCSWTDDPVQGEWAYGNYKGDCGSCRRLDNNYHYPGQYDPNDPWWSSQLVSGTLWQVREALAPDWGPAVTEALLMGTLGFCAYNERFTDFWKHFVYADRKLRHSRDLMIIQEKFQERGFTAPANTAPQIDSMYFTNWPSLSSPDTIFEGESYALRAETHQIGYPDSTYLQFVWTGEGAFGSLLASPPDSIITYTAPAHQPGETPPVARSIILAVYDGLGGVDLDTISFFVHAPCFCGAPWGDLNNDGALNPADVLVMVRYVYNQIDLRVFPPGWACPKDVGDWNCDGAKNPGDVIVYVRFVYNAIDLSCPNPCGE